MLQKTSSQHTVSASEPHFRFSTTPVLLHCWLAVCTRNAFLLAAVHATVGSSNPLCFKHNRRTLLVTVVGTPPTTLRLAEWHTICCQYTRKYNNEPVLGSSVQSKSSCQYWHHRALLRLARCHVGRALLESGTTRVPSCVKSCSKSNCWCSLDHGNHSRVPMLRCW